MFPCESVYVVSEGLMDRRKMFKWECVRVGMVGRKVRTGGARKGGWIDGGRFYRWNSLFTGQKGIPQIKNVCINLYK